MGITAKHKKELELTDLNTETFLAIALNTVTNLNWQISEVTTSEISAYTSFSLYSWSEKVTIQVEKNKVLLKSECTGNQIIDFGKNKNNINLFITQFEQLKNNLSEGEIIEKIKLFNEALSQSTENKLDTKVIESNNFNSILSILKPSKGYFITPIIIYLNVLYFLVMVFNGVDLFEPSGDSLLPWGANYKAITLNGEWWRMVSSCFIHIGIFHLLMNMYALIYIGLLLEPILGKMHFLSAYLLSGLLASLISLWWHDNSVGAGASGAIFGMYGVFLALLTTNYIEQSARKVFLSSIGIFVGYNLLNGIKGNVDNAAHIGGLISGMAIGYAFLPSLRNINDLKLKHLIIGLVAVTTAIITSLVYISIPNNIGIYLSKMKEFGEREEVSLGIYKIDPNASKQQILNAIEYKGIYSWKENVNIINDLEKLDLPSEIKNKIEPLKNYSNLRLKLNQLLFKQINEETNDYKFEIDSLNKQIEIILADYEKLK